MVQLASREIPGFILERMHRYRFIFVTQDSGQLEEDESENMISIPFEGISRNSFLELALLFARALNLFREGETLVCILGNPDAEPWDTIFVSEIRGSYSGVMGLPLFETMELLHASGFALSPCQQPAQAIV